MPPEFADLFTDSSDPRAQFVEHASLLNIVFYLVSGCLSLPSSAVD